MRGCESSWLGVIFMYCVAGNGFLPLGIFDRRNWMVSYLESKHRFSSTIFDHSENCFQLPLALVGICQRFPWLFLSVTRLLIFSHFT